MSASQFARTDDPGMGIYRMSAICKSCKAEIHWLKQAEFDGTPVVGAKANPIDAAPHPDGNLVISVGLGLYRFATGNEKEMQKLHGKKLYISHFQTCPYAEKFRPKKKAEPTFNLFDETPEAA